MSTNHEDVAALRATPTGPTSIVGVTLFGEARGTGDAERAGIAATIQNRIAAKRRAWGLTPDAVCLMPWQYSCWTPSGGLANYETVMDAVRQLLSPDAVFGPQLRTCLALAAEVVAGVVTDTTFSSTHYLTRALYLAKPPSWARGLIPACQIGGTVFFAGVD